MKLSERLHMTANMVRPGMPIADVGTDHAYLPVYLIREGIIPRAFAGDVRKGPLENARMTVERFSLTDKIQLVLSDGLKNFEPNCVNDIVIAGMGGNLISGILSECDWVKTVGNHFVLQPQSHAEVLREYLTTNGFEIIREDVAREGKHLYLAMEVVYTGNVIPRTPEYFYIGELRNSKSALLDLYLNHVYKRIKTRADALEGSDPNSEELYLLKSVMSGFDM